MAEEWPKKVRTTMRPDQEIEVGEAEYIDLQRQSLLVEDAKKRTAAPARSEKES